MLDRSHPKFLGLSRSRRFLRLAILTIFARHEEIIERITDVLGLVLSVKSWILVLFALLNDKRLERSYFVTVVERLLLMILLFVSLYCVFVGRLSDILSHELVLILLNCDSFIARVLISDAFTARSTDNLVLRPLNNLMWTTLLIFGD